MNHCTATESLYHSILCDSFLYTTSGPGLEKWPGFWGSTVFYHAPFLGRGWVTATAITTLFALRLIKVLYGNFLCFIERRVWAPVYQLKTDRSDMPLFKNEKSTDAKKAKRATLITKILDDSQELTAQLKEHTDLKNTMKNQIEQMRHD